MRHHLGAALVAGLCLPALLAAAGPARADTSVTLPDGHARYTTRDGVAVTVARTGEHARISASMASSPLSRNAWASAVTSVSTTGPAGVKITGGRIETGYLVGCQIDIGHAEHANASGDQADQPPPTNANGNSSSGDSGNGVTAGNGNGNSGGGGNSAGGGNSGGGDNGGGSDNGGLKLGDYDDGVTIGPDGVSPYADPDTSLTLKPGQVATKKIAVYNFTGTSGTNQYVDHTLSVEGCAGYAEARSYTTVLIQDSVMDSTETLWGRPFSLG
ncbi:MspA family porin [Nocardia alni]|uniref:MspA family porin n=1 Tax=Nocardia alni TaxID=2815723 RepID=UPI001C22E9DB|nr:MspA family porin [Nocardia alni]